MARNAYSSLGASIAAYQPYYAPPVTPQPNYINGGTAAVTSMPHQEIDQHTSLVNRMPSMLGIRWLYSRGGQIKPWFRSIATGAVESTKFQPVLSYTWSGEFNDAIYQAGYPRNLGYTFKVDTISPQALGQERFTMRPSPRITKPIFTRRAYTSGVKPVPAQAVNYFRRNR
jgi:hypothetical protein